MAAKPNNAATGTPTISGTTQVGETLSADVSTIADTDGLTNVSYSYQWIRSDGTADSDIADATGTTYVLVAADQDHTIKVRVSFADDAANTEELTSTPTAAVSAAIEPVTIEEDDDGLVWSATMTAALLLIDHGYSGLSGSQGGALTTASFEIDGVTYSVGLIGAAGWMYIGFDKQIPTAFTLDVDGTQLESTDAEFTSYTYSNVYFWPDAQMTWSEGDTVELKLHRTGTDPQ